MLLQFERSDTLGEMSNAHDDATILFYRREAQKYAARREALANPRLDAFLARLAPGAEVLELGCGGGHDAQIMLNRGFLVTPTDGSPELARQAELRLGRPVQVMRFDELTAESRYDAVWANGCLLHVPESELAGVLSRVNRALTAGGVFYSSFKAGNGGGRDALGRYYNFPNRSVLEAAFHSAGDWSELAIEESEGGGYDGVARVWFHVLAARAG